MPSSSPAPDSPLGDAPLDTDAPFDTDGPFDTDAPRHTAVADLGEFGLIGALRDTLGDPADAPDDLVMGIADDAAVYRIGDGRVHVLTTDALVEGVHFDRAFAPMEHLGFKALSVNVSDIAAMNARPRFATLTLGLPQNVSVEALQTLYAGVRQAARAYGVTVVGGDTVAAAGLTLSVAVVGEADEDAVVYRRGARPGDALCVTGDLGSSYAGLKVLLDERRRLEAEGDAFTPRLDDFTYVVRRHLAPPAQLKTVEDWAAAGLKPHALIDISDGLASEVHHLCEASGTGALLFGPALPIHRQTAAAADHFGEGVDQYALFGGEDYQLLFAVDPADLEKLDQAHVSVVGQVTEPGEGIRIRSKEDEEMALQPGGYDHFAAGEKA